MTSFIALGSLLAVVPIGNLPEIEPYITTYQVSSHNKKGLNGDGGWYLYAEPGDAPGLSGWVDVDEGASAQFTEARVHDGKGALVHRVFETGGDSGWRSVRKTPISPIDAGECDRLSLWIWPGYADGDVDYGIRLDSDGQSTEIPIEGLSARTWNHVMVELKDIPRDSVGAFWLLFNKEWGMESETEFFVDDIVFLEPDDEQLVVDRFEEPPQRAVLFDAAGPGQVCNIWSLGGGDIRIEADGKVLADATQDEFFGGGVPGFPEPAVFKGLLAAGPWDCVSHWSMVAIPFKRRCKISTSNLDPFYHVIAERFTYENMVYPWLKDNSIERCEKWWNSAGKDPKGWVYLTRHRGSAEIKAHNLARAPIEGPGTIGLLALNITPKTPEVLSKIRLQFYWDGEDEPSVDSPPAIFFGAGVEWKDIPGLLVGVDGEWGYCFLPMPFFREARFQLVNNSDQDISMEYNIGVSEKKYAGATMGYFHAEFNSDEHTDQGNDYTILHITGRGHYIGCVQTMEGGHYCEGDERFYVDGSRSPAFYGTGTEDYYLAACWPNVEYYTPMAGCVVDVTESAEKAGDSREKAFYHYPACYYRFHLDAPVRFRSELLCGIEHGGTNDTDSSYSSVAYYYARDDVYLEVSDTVRFGDLIYEKTHQVEGGESVERVVVDSSFEGDDDDVVHHFEGIATTEPLRLTLNLVPQNRGLRLRRVFDQGIGRQWADVYIEGKRVGTWYNPGENRFKRLAESDFEVPQSLVSGKKQVQIELRPKYDSPPWTILELQAICHVRRFGR